MSDVAMYKNTTVEGLDAFFASANKLRDNYEYALELLRENQSLAEIITQLQESGRGPRYAYPTPTDSPLADVENLDEVVHDGYTLAIERALDRERRGEQLVPLETLWMTSASDDIEIHVCEGKRLITVLWLIPVVRQYGSERANSTSWRVEAGTTPVQTSGLEDATATTRAGP